MKKFFSAVCDLVGVALLGKGYLLRNYTEKELADMGVIVK